MHRIAALAPILALAMTAPVEARTNAPIAEALATVMTADARLQTIGWRLAQGNALFCPDTVSAIGLLLLDVRNYRDPQAIRTALALYGDIAVDAVAVDSPADRAGLRAGDEVLSLAGMPMTELPQVPAGDFERVASLQDRIDAALLADGRVMLSLRRSGDIAIAGEPICRSRFALSAAGSNAGSDGHRVRVREDFLAGTVDDDEAAAAMAHELAHNILRHPQRLTRIGRNTAAVRATEAEADRLAPWLMANAGYNPEAAARFAEGRRRAAPPAIFQAPTHERWDKRLVAIREEIAAIAAMRASDLHGPLDWRKRFGDALAAASQVATSGN